MSSMVKSCATRRALAPRRSAVSSGRQRMFRTWTVRSPAGSWSARMPEDPPSPSVPPSAEKWGLSLFSVPIFAPVALGDDYQVIPTTGAGGSGWLESRKVPAGEPVRKLPGPVTNAGAGSLGGSSDHAVRKAQLEVTGDEVRLPVP